ncbi:hypothetical protein ACMAZF_20280 (plasmid) [Psychrobium sp. nBUS_13]|uniref:hypothetical protein n=1 Tax=Psychrobium sp. nBUS_13 TaxID=3395319 RepID=UPI003EB9AD3B
MNFNALLDYMIDLARGIGISLFVVSIFTIALEKTTNAFQLSMNVKLLVFSLFCVIFGGVLSAAKKEKE